MVQSEPLVGRIDDWPLRLFDAFELRRTRLDARPVDPNHLPEPSRTSLRRVDINHRLSDDGAGRALISLGDKEAERFKLLEEFLRRHGSA